MDWPMLAWGRLADAAAGGLIVLAVGSAAALLCRQPVRRARLIVLTLLGGMVVPCLGALSITPRWSSGLLPPIVAEAPSGDAEPAVPSQVVGPSADVEPISARARDDRLLELPSHTAVRDTEARPRAVPISPRPEWRRLVPSARTGILTCYLAVAAGFGAWWAIGQVMLWKVSRSARPVPADVRSLLRSLAGPGSERVVLLESDRITLPFTYTWLRPVILLPTALCRGNDPDALRYALAHEWSHVERRDAWAWNLANLAGLLLFYQPLFWWLRRQLRLSQDYLADARAAAAGSPEDYAAFLVRLARTHASDPAVAALGIVDRRSNLSRRVMMLVLDHEPLERRCRAAWSFSAVVAAIAVIVVASGFRLSSAAPPDEKAANPESKASQDPAKSSPDPKPTGETLHYTGTVVDKDTNKGIAGATVVVRRSISRARENRVLQETRHTTGSDGTYSFTIPPDQVASPYLYIELDVEHPDYATRAGFGYALSMTRKNEKLNERPFFERIELRPAQPITGRIETPEGEPAAGVELLAYSRTDKIQRGHFEYGSFARAKTDAEGKFRLPITTPGQGVFWVLPRTYALEMHALAEGKRGDLGTFTLKKGVIVTGQMFDVQGKPLAGQFIEISRERGSGPDFELLGQLIVADSIRRTAETDAEGRFTFGPLPPAVYRVMPTETNFTGDRSAGWTRRELPGVFAPKKVTISEGETPPPLEVRATPHVVLEGRWLDSQGKPKGGWSSHVFGRVDGSFWFGEARPDAEGRFSMKAPHGLEKVEFSIMTNEHASARHRVGKEGPLLASNRLSLDTLDHDVKDIEIVRYVAPIIIINAKSDGKQIKDFKATAAYVGNHGDRSVSVVGGGKLKEALQDEQYDGRYRTSQLLPDEEVTVTVSADGFATASRTLSLPEGKVEEVTFDLVKK